MLVRLDTQGDGDEADLDAEEDGDTAPASDRAPQWLVDFRRSSGRGFYQSLGDHALILAERGCDHLLVSFDNLSSARDDAMDRNPWGYDFVARNGWSQLGVLAYRPSWFRDEALFAELRRLAEAGLFRRFGRVTMTGTSMGGYAACAFASLVPGCDVIAFSPQSTLSRKLVPWEPRFSIGRKADWSGDFADAAEESRAARRVWLVYDPYFEADRRHAARFDAPNVVHLPARNAGHKSALFLRRAGILSRVMRQAVSDQLTPASFAAALRQGRNLPWFLNGLANRLIERGRAGQISRLMAALEGADGARIARNIGQRAAGAGLAITPLAPRPVPAARPTGIAFADERIVLPAPPASAASMPEPTPPGAADLPVWVRFRQDETSGAHAGSPWRNEAREEN